MPPSNLVIFFLTQSPSLPPFLPPSFLIKVAKVEVEKLITGTMTAATTGGPQGDKKRKLEGGGPAPTREQDNKERK